MLDSGLTLHPLSLGAQDSLKACTLVRLDRMQDLSPCYALPPPCHCADVLLAHCLGVFGLS